MPEQLIYTSAPRGLVAGRSGHCTVAHTAGMREALRLQLEKWSYYQHHALTGGNDRPIYSCRIADIRNSPYYVLSKIQDSGLDFTGRTNFIAHHLVFTSEEIRQFPSPPIILRDWNGWEKSWEKDREPQLLDKEVWPQLPTLKGSVSIPANNWLGLTGDAVNGYGLLEARAGIAFRVDGLLEREILTLFAESLALLELRDPRGDFQGSAWQYTFTTSMQEQDNPADYRWRCLFSDNPTSSRFAGPDSKKLTDVRPARVSNQEGIFARIGPQAPKFVKQPQANVKLTLGETTTLSAEAEGVPTPVYQWFSVDRNGNSQEIRGATGPEFFVHNPPLGTSRYLVRAINPLGPIDSGVATLNIDHAKSANPAPRSSPTRPEIATRSVELKSKPDHQQNAENRPKQRQSSEQTNVYKNETTVWSILWSVLKPAIVICLVLFVGVGLWQFSKLFESKKSLNFGEAPSVVEFPKKPAGNAQTQPTPAKEPKLDSKLPSANVKDGPPNQWSIFQIGQTEESKVTHSDSPGVTLNLSTVHTKGFLTNGDSLFFVGSTTINHIKARLEWDKATKHDGKPVAGVMQRTGDERTAPFAFIGVREQTIIGYLRTPDGQTYFEQKVIQAADRGKPIDVAIGGVAPNVLLSYSFDSSNYYPFEVRYEARQQPILDNGNTRTNANGGIITKLVRVPIPIVESDLILEGRGKTIGVVLYSGESKKEVKATFKILH